PASPPRSPRFPSTTLSRSTLATATLDRHGPLEDDPDADVLRVLVHAGLDADKHANEQTCPACGEKDGIRFLGTRLATLLSVALTSLFGDRKSTRLNSSHVSISYAVFCLKKKIT